jgi:hypothetical protein
LHLLLVLGMSDPRGVDVRMNGSRCAAANTMDVVTLGGVVAVVVMLSSHFPLRIPGWVMGAGGFLIWRGGGGW